MSDEANLDAVRLGYFLVREIQSLGTMGGLLVLTVDGRPLEFHCTEPVCTNRAQEILYGPTLRAYVVGDRIGGALLKQCSAGIDLLIATDPDEASAAQRAELPWVVVSEESTSPPLGELDPRLAAALRRLSAAVDLAEPFQRIRLAIDEAHRIQGTGGADDSAAA